VKALDHGLSRRCGRRDDPSSFPRLGDLALEVFRAFGALLVAQSR
jgi:hypothetical protein